MSDATVKIGADFSEARSQFKSGVSQMAGMVSGAGIGQALLKGFEAGNLKKTFGEVWGAASKMFSFRKWGQNWAKFSKAMAKPKGFIDTPFGSQKVELRGTERLAAGFAAVKTSMTGAIIAAAALAAGVAVIGRAVAKLEQQMLGFKMRAVGAFDAAIAGARNLAREFSGSIAQAKTDIEATIALLMRMNVTRTTAIGASGELASIARDMAAFAGTDMATALAAIESAMSGNDKALTAFGKRLTKDIVRQKAFEIGAARDPIRPLTPLARRAAVTQLIKEDPGESRGAARAMENTFIGSITKVWDSFKNMLADITEGIGSMVSVIGPSVSGLAKLLAGAFDLIGGIIRVVLSAIGLILSPLKVLFGLSGAAFGTLGEIFSTLANGARSWADSMDQAAQWVDRVLNQVMDKLLWLRRLLPQALGGLTKEQYNALILQRQQARALKEQIKLRNKEKGQAADLNKAIKEMGTNTGEINRNLQVSTFAKAGDAWKNAVEAIAKGPWFPEIETPEDKKKKALWKNKFKGPGALFGGPKVGPFGMTGSKPKVGPFGMPVVPTTHSATSPFLPALGPAPTGGLGIPAITLSNNSQLGQILDVLVEIRDHAPEGAFA